MILLLNEHYKLKFVDVFNVLDGVYKVTGLYTYQQILDTNIDLEALLYGYVSKTDEQLATDMAIYVNDIFYNLVDANTGKAVCTPTTLLVSNDPFVKQYYGVMLTVNMGMFEDPAIVYPIADVVLDTLRDRLGNPDLTEEELELVETLAGLPDLRSNIQVYLKEWMVCSEYVETVQRRRLARDRAEELGGKSHTNYCTMYLNTLANLRTTEEKLRITEAKLIELMETP